MTSFTVEPIFDSWPLLLAMAAVLIGVPFLVRVHGDELDGRRRRILMALRLVGGLVLLLAALRPTLLTTDSMPGRATVAILLDQSRSMTLPAETEKSRWEVQQETWQTLYPALSQLDESLDLRVIGYSDRATELSPAQVDAGAIWPEDSSGPTSTTASDAKHSPTGNATDLSAALSASLRAAAGQPLAGVILIGDGVHNPRRNRRSSGGLAANASGEPAADDSPGASPGDPQNAARTLASLDVPLWTVPIGPPGDADQVRDVEVDELAESLSVFAGNDFKLDFVIRSRALQGVEMPIRVKLTPEPSSGEATQGETVEVATRRLTPTRTTDSIAMSIPLTAPPPGAYRLEVAVDPQEGETLLTNNSQFAFVDVREGGGRILYLEGQPRPEQTFIRRSLRRFPDLDMTYRWISEDTSRDWPIDLGDLLKPGRFDIYVIGDLPAAALGNAQLEKIATAVDTGGGLLVLGGLNAFDSGGYGSTPLSRVLPIRMDEGGGSARPGEPGSTQIVGDVTPRVSRPHPITTLNLDDDSIAGQQSTWDELPPLSGANRLAGPRVAPGVNVLLESADGSPLMVIGEYGRGRVITFAGDSTWRWWRRGKDASHRRFWRQTVLWLLDRGDESDLGLTLDLSQRRFESGDKVTWRASRTGAGDAEIAFQIVAPDGSASDVVADTRSSDTRSPGGDADADGQSDPISTFEGTIPTLPAGLYRLRATIPENDSAVEKSFQVLDNDRELARPFADLTYLAQLSAQTSVSGGASYLPSQVDELIRRITELRRTSSSPVIKKYRLGDHAGSAWPMFLALVGLLSVEWVLRRRWGLV